MMVLQESNDTSETLVPSDDQERYHLRWASIQASFVDDPLAATRTASELLTEVTERISELLAKEQAFIDSRWDSDRAASTEILRTCLQGYRHHLDRLLSVRTDNTQEQSSTQPEGSTPSSSTGHVG